MNDETVERAQRLEALLPRVMRALGRPEEPDPLSGLSVAQLRMMRLLFASERTPSSVSEELGLSMSAITQMANRLERGGLVDRAMDTDDRRLKHVHLTRLGRKLMERRRDQRVARAAKMLALLPEARQSEVLNALEDLVAAFDCQTEHQGPARDGAGESLEVRKT